MKILITGFSGFVAQHFVNYLFESGENHEVVGIDIIPPSFEISKYASKLDIKFMLVNLTNMVELNKVFESFIPEYILHLASYSSVSFSWDNPSESFINNSYIFLNLIQSIREFNPQCRVLSVGSSEEYGNVSSEDIPLLEEHSLNPISPYAVARVAQEQLSKVFVEAYGMNIVLTRSFNHIGPYQRLDFSVPSFISRILDIRLRNESKGVIETGDVSIVRDFVDVRDVVRAYYLLLLHGNKGEVYNVCSGHGVKLLDLIRMIAEVVGVEVDPVVDNKLVRPNDNMVIVGSPCKIKKELGWNPTISLRQSIVDMVTYIENLE